MKRLVSILLCLAMLVAMVPATVFQAAATEESGGYTTTQKQAAELAASDTGTKGAWYVNGSTFDTTAGAANYIEIAAEGCEDVGSLHVYQDNVANNDMSVAIFLGGQAAGTYTLKMNVKGDLGYLGQVCRFYPYGSMDQFGNIHDTLGAEQASDWTTVTYENIQVGADFFYFIFTFSKYNWQTDMYIDNIQLLNSSGVDVLAGSGDFYVETQVAAEGLFSIDTTKVSSPSSAYAGEWIPFCYYTEEQGLWKEGWPAWDATAEAPYYGEIAEEGYQDAGSLHLMCVPSKNVGVAIETGMVSGESYTLGMWVKGTAASNKMLALCGNGDGTIIGNPAYCEDAAWATIPADWTYIEKAFTADSSVLALYATGWGDVDVYIDHITLKNASGVDLLSGYGDFCYDSERLLSINTEEMFSAYGAPVGRWSVMYPAGTPDDGPWAAWDGTTHYGEIVAAGCKDIGALHLKSVTNTSTGVGIGVNMTEGETYTLGLWAKGTSNSGLVLLSYANGDPTIIGESAELTADWSYYEVPLTCTTTQLNIVASAWGVTDIYVDNISLVGSDGVDLLANHGGFCVDYSDSSVDPEISGSALYRKTAIFSGDSISWGTDQCAWAGRIGEKYRMNYINASVSGASVSTCRGTNRMIAQLEKYKAQTYEYVIMHGGTNDAWDEAAVGTMTDSYDVADFDTTTFAGGLEELFYYAYQYYSGARMGFIINFRFSSNLNYGNLSDMTEYVAVTKQICDKWNIPYLDLYNNDELTTALQVDTTTYIADGVHPNAAGYEIIAPYIDTWMKDVLAEQEPPEAPTAPPAQTQTVLELYDSDPGENYQWYNGSGYTATTGKYIEIVEDGADDVGAVHVYQTDGVTADEDMQVYLKVDSIPAGTYTVKYKIKGTDLGNTDHNYNNFSVKGYNSAATQFRTLAGAKTLSDWTELSETVTTTADSDLFVLYVSRYVNGADYYVDNVRLLDADGNDLLCGAGNFCTGGSSEDTQEPTTPSEPETEVSPYLDTTRTASEGVAYETWTPFFPTGTAAGDWTEWETADENASGYNYAEIVESGKENTGALHFSRADVYEHIGVAIQAGMTVGETYTLTMWAKGSTVATYGGLQLYNNGDGTLTLFGSGQTVPNDGAWHQVTATLTARTSQLNLVLSGGAYTSDVFIDNVRLLDANGTDLLEGMGDFCDPAEANKITVMDTSLTSKDGTAYDVWTPFFPTGVAEGNWKEWETVSENSTGYNYAEIASMGRADQGSLHFARGDVYEPIGVAINAGMTVGKTYTLSFWAKGYANPKYGGMNLYSNGDSEITRFGDGYPVTNDGQWHQVSFTFTATKTWLAIYMAGESYKCNVYIDNMTLTDSDGNELLGSMGNFSTTTSNVMTIDTGKTSSSRSAEVGEWTRFYPTGAADAEGHWDEWETKKQNATGYNYAEIVEEGNNEPGSLHFVRGDVYEHVGVNIEAGMTTGETYTLNASVKGSTAAEYSGLCLYGNGNETIAIFSDENGISNDGQWHDVKVTFTADRSVLDLYLNGGAYTSDIYIDNITLLDANGNDMLDGAGYFIYGAEKLESTLSLEDFNEAAEEDLAAVSGQVSVEGASDPTLTLNTDHAETENAMQATWSYDGTNPSYLHRYAVSGEDSWVSTFAQYAGRYQYLRMWVSNPSHVAVDITVLLSGEDTVNYFDASCIKLIREDGTQAQSSVNADSGYGENSCISVPKQFTGWVSIVLDTANLLPADGYTATIADFANVTGVQLEFRKLASSGEGDSSEYYYVVDDICLGQTITGQQKSTEDGNNYADYDLSVKGEAQVKNIIFMIGDGMGYGALDTARLDRETLYIDTITELGGVMGEVATTNLYGEITDSAAAGTALSTGFLTRNSVLGLTENNEPIMNLGEFMKQLDKKLGLVTTTYVLDATPAAFAAHTTDRSNYASVAKDIMALGVDVVQGGGRSYLKAKTTDSEGNAVTLTELATSDYGYQYATTVDEMNAITSGKLWGIYQDYNMSWTKDNVSTDPTLAEMTTKTFELLENENGFFAMIEGGSIDIAGHDNNATNTRLETLAFDDAVKVAMDYVDSHPDTLLIVTADHETGGVRVAEDGSVSYYSLSHTDELVPYYAYGAGAAYFTDLSVNTDISWAIRRATMGDVELDATSVPTTEELTDTDQISVTVTDTGITYTGEDQIASISLDDAAAKYAVVKYKTNDADLVGMIDSAKISYAGDGLWHISDVLVLTEGQSHTFQPIAYVKGESYNSIEIEGLSVEIAWVGLYDTYEAAAAFQAEAALNDTLPAAGEALGELDSASLTLGDDLALKLYVTVDETVAADAYMQITVGSGEPASVKVSEAEKDESGCYIFTAHVAAAQMNDTITLRLAVGEETSKVGTYSVRKYADAVLADESLSDCHALVSAMLNYGAKAQTYFGYNADDLADDGITVEAAAVPTTTDRAVVSGSASGICYYGATLVFGSKTAVRYYFAVTGDIADHTFTVGEDAYQAVAKDALYYVEVPGVNPQDLDEKVVLTVSNGTEEFTVTYAPMCYIVNMYNGGGSENLKALLQALYGYYLAAEAYAAAA